MKGVDTNVLVRLMVSDDRAQTDRARSFVTANAPCWINRVVMCETAWVLESAYSLGRRDIAGAFETLLETADFEIEDADAVRSGVRALQAGGDFADAVIAHTNRGRGCAGTATFDRRAAKTDDFELI